MKKHIPNFITLLNLFSGFTAIVFAANHNMGGSLIMMCCALLFDFCDGLVARLLHVKSELGKQLDSLSDLVSFGVAPAFTLYQIDAAHFAKSLADDQALGIPEIYEPLQIHGIVVIPFIICAIYVCAGALRLGKFNLDDRQTENFRGLPIPLAAITIISMKFCYLPFTVNYATCLIASILMLTSIPLFSLKFKNFHWKENLHRYIFLFISAILLAAFVLTPELYAIQAIPLITICYIIVSLIFRKKITA
jgi:CDP-diacylglycerol--serine O-phosphatidyltransferase